MINRWKMKLNTPTIRLDSAINRQRNRVFIAREAINLRDSR